MCEKEDGEYYFYFYKKWDFSLLNLKKKKCEARPTNLLEVMCKNITRMAEITKKT